MPSGLSGLKNLAKKVEKKDAVKKSKVVVLDPAPVAKAEELWVTASQQIGEANAVKEQAERTILDYAEPCWLDTCRTQGEAENSCAIGRVRLTFKGKSQFATKTSLDADRLRNTFGDEQYEQYFMEKEGPMQLTPEAVSNPIIVEKLIEAITKISEEFPETQIITYDTTIVPKDALFQDWVLKAEQHEKLNAKLKSAGVQRTKTSFSTR